MMVGGTQLRDFSVPTRYNPSGSNAGLATGDRGIDINLAFVPWPCRPTAGRSARLPKTP